jgi:hypothetical protein
MSSINRLIFSILVKIFYGLGIFVGVLPFSFDRLKNSVKRSRALECYSFLFISYQIIYMTTMYMRTSFIISDEILFVANFLQLFSIVLNLMVLLICLVGNRKAIVDLVNDGLKIEQDFRNKFYSKPWNLNFIFLIFSKDIIQLIGHTYFSISAKRNSGNLYHYYKIVSAVTYLFSLGFLENLKIVLLFHVSHLLGMLNKSLSRAKRTNNTESIREISEMYDRLLIFAEKICKILRFRMTTTLIQFLVMTSTEVWDKFKKKFK